VLLAIIGARTYYVLTTLKDSSGNWNYYSLKDVIAIWEGGIAIYGAIIGGALGIWAVSKVKKYSKTQLLKMTDMVAPGVMLGQIIGRWGNFINGEAHGVETSESFWLRMGLMGAADCKYPNKITYYHPTFLYESLWNLAGFVLINLLYKKKKFDGQVLLMYLAWYGFGRMFIEGLRTDSLYIGVFRISQVVGFLCFAICGGLLAYLLLRAKRREMDSVAYESLYEKSNTFSILRSPKKEGGEETDPQETKNEHEEQSNDEAD
jgi:phosphatidylglycerol:prolipoprotein diacylglycerol transferase